MTNLTPLQNQITETIWTQIEDYNEAQGSTFAAMQFFIGQVADYFNRYLEPCKNVDTTLYGLKKVCETIGWDFQAIVDENNADEIFNELVKEHTEDPFPIQGMLLQQMWMALTSDFNRLAADNDGHEALTKCGQVLEHLNGTVVEAIYN